MKPFGYERATTVEEAAGLVREHGPGARLLAGGQSLLPMMNLGLYEPEVLIDIGSIPRLSGIEDSGGKLVIGATTRHRYIESDMQVLARQPMLADAIRHVGSSRIRNVGTIGGSVVHNDPAAELPLVMSVLGAGYELTNGESVRTVKAQDFAVGSFTTAIGDDEILTSIDVPFLEPGWSWGFREFSYREGDFAVAAAAVLARFDGSDLAEVRVMITGVGGGPAQCDSYERAAIGRPVEALREIEALVTADVDYVMDGLESGEFRAHIAGVMSSRAIEDAFKRGRKDALV